MPAGRGDYRVYDIKPLGPFRAAFAEKTRFCDTELTIVFLAEHISAFCRLMSPSSEYYTDTVNRVLFELLYLTDGGVPVFSSLSREIFALVEKIPRLAEAIFSRRCGTRCCELAALLEKLLLCTGEDPGFSDIRLRLIRRDSASGGAEDVADIPVEALTSVLTIVLDLFRSLTTDNAISVTLNDLGVMREILIRTGCPSDLFQVGEDDGLDSLFSLPEEFHSRLHMAEILCAITHLEPAVRKDADTVSLSLLIGRDPPALLDFKYSDPVSAAPAIIKETLALFR